MNRNEKASWYDAGPVTQYKAQPEAVTCKKCGCGWLEQILLQRYPKFHNVILGQKVNPIDESGFWVFKCIKCGEVYEPNVQVNTHDTMRRFYDNFLDDMEKPLEEEVEMQGAVKVEPVKL